MAITFPTTLDSLTNPASTDGMNSPSHADQHSDNNDAIEALEAKVGIDGSADTDSLDYKVTSASSSDPGHKHTLANGATDVTASAAELNALVGINDGWVSFVPSWTNLTTGNGTLTAYYTQIGKTVFFRLYFILGSTSSVSGAVSFTLPVTAIYESINGPVNTHVWIRDSDPATNILGWGRCASSTTMTLGYFGVSGSVIGVGSFNATTPITWATGDTVSAMGFYEAA